VKEIKSLSREGTSDPLLTAALFTMDNSLEQLRWPLRVRGRSCPVIRKEEIFPFPNKISGLCGHYTETS